MQGFNMGRYVPPEFEGMLSHNQVSKKHALGNRASKSHLGILTGVRFNAEKKKVGNYHSTPIFSFRMKHVACGGWIEITTDPKNTAYVVTDGARKRDLGEDKVEEGDVKIMTSEEREALRNNAFASLEGKVEDNARLLQSKERIEDLQDIQDQQWDDPYEKNRKLRRAFRIGRKEREQEGERVGQLQDKMSFGFDILPENDDDVRRAGFIEFGEASGGLSTTKALSKPLFKAPAPLNPTPLSTGRKTKKLKAELVAEERKANFAAELRDNTRARLDPFLMEASSKVSIRTSLGIKRKRSQNGEQKAAGLVGAEGVSKGLVEYDSD